MAVALLAWATWAMLAAMRETMEDADRTGMTVQKHNKMKTSESLPTRCDGGMTDRVPWRDSAAQAGQAAKWAPSFTALSLQHPNALHF